MTEENRTSSEQEVDTQREKVNNLKETLQTTSRYTPPFFISFIVIVT